MGETTAIESLAYMYGVGAGLAGEPLLHVHSDDFRRGWTVGRAQKMERVLAMAWAMRRHTQAGRA